MNWITRFLDFISPRECVVCGHRLAPTERSVCSVCLFHLPRTDFHLNPLDNQMAQLFWKLTTIQKAAALFYYHPHSEMAQIVYRLKYNNRPDIGEDMGRVMACELQCSDFFSDIDILLPVPLSRKRFRQRGYRAIRQPLPCLPGGPRALQALYPRPCPRQNQGRQTIA